ncbi:MAG: hypothetical protein AAB345_01490 [Patescibacteria group bacterium]
MVQDDTDDFVPSGNTSKRIWDHVSNPIVLKEFMEFCAKNNKKLRPTMKLFLRHLKSLSKESWDTKELYFEILRTALSGQDFRHLITVGNQGDPFWNSVADHNGRVVLEISDRGIDDSEWVWSSLSETEELLEHDPSKVEELWEELERELAVLVTGYIGSNLHQSIAKDVMGIKKRKSEIKKGKINLPIPLESPFFPTYNKTFTHLKKRGKKIIGPMEGTNQVYWGIHDIFRAFAGQANRKRYTVKLWERSPGRDLLQGNWSGCCIAVGKRGLYPAPELPLNDVDYKKYPAGILEFLIDKGIQVAEISEEGWGVVGQAWLFLSPNENGGADLIADSIDIDSERIHSRPQKRAVRSCLLRFLRDFAERIWAKRALIGKNGPLMENGERRGIQIDVETFDLPVVDLSKPISKVGGYFRNRPYFLESRHGTQAFQIP